MPRKYGKDSNFKGNKNSGDKPDHVKLAVAIKEGVDLALAQRIVNRRLGDIDKKKKLTDEDLRIVAMPIAIKGMVEKKEVSINMIDDVLRRLDK
jgi:hypothetical protein